jgi:DNA-directed RNA polymerase subunit M/transcription elongation factor TFIIS
MEQSMKEEKEQAVPWTCDKCKEKLVPRKVKVSYLAGNFEVELMKCPKCNHVFIGEDLALGRMLEVEKGLEDK